MNRVALLLITVAALSSGCASLSNPTADGVPVNRLPVEALARPKADLRPVPLTALRQPSPGDYRLDAGDVLAVVADPTPLPAAGIPPVRPSDDPAITGAVGYPVTVRADGTVSLPLIGPVSVRGRTVAETERLLRDAILQAEIAQPAVLRVSVQLLQRRRYRVTIVREDSQPVGNTTTVVGAGAVKRGAGYKLYLPAYENDVLGALASSGGMPGLDARNEVIVQRAAVDLTAAAVEIRIPLRVYPDEPLVLRPEDVILGDGDVVRIEARDTEVFYTAGLVGGGQYLLPRDADLDVIEALAQVRGPLLNGGFSQTAFVASSVNSGVGNPSPSLCTILRKLPGGRQIPIRVDLNKAFHDPRERVLIRPGDVIVLQERPAEAVVRYFTQQIRFLTTFDLLNPSSNTSAVSVIVP